MAGQIISRAHTSESFAWLSSMLRSISTTTSGAGCKIARMTAFQYVIERSLYYYRVSPASVFLSFSGVFGRCVCGMMISRLPKSRRSTDVFPGPRRDSAIATIITRIVGSGS